MSIIQRDYLQTKPVEFPPELALLIVRKASRMAAQFEDKALDEMTKAATRRETPGMPVVCTRLAPMSGAAVDEKRQERL